VTVRSGTAASGEAWVTVSDTGVGIKPEHREKLFSPFFTTKAHGMGMGLAISRTIVELHHGRLSVGSRESGPGTTVRLVLPVSEAEESST